MMSVASCALFVLANATLPQSFCAQTLPVTVNEIRGIVSLGSNSLLAVETSTSSVILLTDTNNNNDGLPDSRKTVATASGLNHGLALNGGYLYASSSTTVYRWAYSSGAKLPLTNPQVVIQNINAGSNGVAIDAGHSTRTLAFDSTGRLYVSVGSTSNVDSDSFRARIRRFNISSSLNSKAIEFITGEVFADGLRNEVGLAFDRHQVLWGVENGADKLNRKDLGGDIHNDNPAEELNQFREVDQGKHWGYPFCWTEFSLPVPPGRGRGSIWAWPDFLPNVSDAQCRTSKFVPPKVAMQAHSAPLGITFYQYNDQPPSECAGRIPFPKSMDGYAFIAFHGSWNRAIPTGYKVVYIAMNAAGEPVGQPVDLLAHKSENAPWDDGFRPVDVKFTSCGELLVSSDGTNGKGSKIVRIKYTVVAPPSPKPRTRRTPSRTRAPHTRKPRSRQPT